MPPRAPPKAYQVLLKTHKLTIFFTVHQSSTIATLKEETLSALTSPTLSSSSGIPAPSSEDLGMDQEDGDTEIPPVTSVKDFELCRAIKDKSGFNAASSGSTVVSYKVLDPASPIKGLLNNWEVLYIQFRDPEGDLFPVQVSQFTLLDEEDEEPRRAPPAPESPAAIGKGKRKAPPE